MRATYVSRIRGVGDRQEDFVGRSVLFLHSLML